jgi:DNA polymerase III subunit delta'
MTLADVLDGALAPAENTTLFGHEEAERFLASAYRSGRIHHAVLIEGPQGIGKATLAFRFAHHVLANPDPAAAPANLSDPDPASPIHRQIASGASHNLLHLARPVDEKTGRIKTAITVDEVRRAARLFSQTSGTGNWRIVIVDPADDMNRSAANAILKILEEPPARSLFLVISHAPGRLLPTIRSRCLTLRLSPLGRNAMDAALQAMPVAKLLPPNDRERILARAGGSVSRALMMIGYGGLEIIDAFDKIVSRSPIEARKDIHRLADSLSAKDRDEAFQFFTAHVEDWVTERARQSAVSGDVERAAAYALLSERMAQEIATSAAYNLDRKQTVLSLFSALLSPSPA